jgi:Na+/H+ antiporter NhaC
MGYPIAKDIAMKYGIDPRRSASLMDIFSCVMQGLISYGAQLLMAAGQGGISPLSIMQYLYYPYLLGLATLLAIYSGYPRKYARR